MKSLYKIYRRVNGCSYLIGSYTDITSALYALQEYQSYFGRQFVYMNKETLLFGKGGVL